jgi:hypothetical protein
MIEVFYRAKKLTFTEETKASKKEVSGGNGEIAVARVFDGGLTYALN